MKSPWGSISTITVDGVEWFWNTGNSFLNLLPPPHGWVGTRRVALWVRFLIPPVENRTCDFHRIRLSTFRSVLVFALWHDVHIGWRCFMRSASVVSLNRARGIIWSTSTSLGWSVVPHM